HPTAVFVTRFLVLFEVAPIGVVPRPCGVSEVQGGSACEPSTLWRSEVAVLMDVGACVMRLWSHVVASAFRELLCLSVCVPTVCFCIVFDSTGSAGVVVVASTFVGLPAALASRDSLSQEFVAGQSWWQFVVPCVASSVSCERERLSRELRVAFLQVLGVVSFPAGSECELQDSVLTVAGCACFERGCWFARAAVEFVVDLPIRVGVSRRLREPTCGVAITGAGLWSAEPVEGVLALWLSPFDVVARAKQMLVCRVAPLVERCDT
ncbi:hypothetical protein Taro_036854, partial [Colocasia esculenta]|nr:hypothetical protein [Colocasia esculenta]